MVLHVKTDNKKAIKLYERLGYNLEEKLPILRIEDKSFELFRMGKDIEKDGNGRSTWRHSAHCPSLRRGHHHTATRRQPEYLSASMPK